MRESARTSCTALSPTVVVLVVVAVVAAAIEGEPKLLKPRSSASSAFLRGWLVLSSNESASTVSGST